MSEQMPKTRRAFEELLRSNGYRERLIKKLSANFPTSEEEAAEDERELLASLQELTKKMGSTAS